MPIFSFSFPLHMLFSLFIFSVSLSSSTHSFHDDRQSLLAFKNGITSDPHGSMTNWSPAVPFCNWTAITCSRRHVHRVTSLNLNSMDLEGYISPSLGNFSFLHTLDLSGNALYGHIPYQLGRLFRLNNLSLYNNQLDGNIPRDLGNCTNLAYMALSYNNLTGSIPQELGSLTNLQQLFLGENSLTGKIPLFWSNISTLIDLEISANKLTGSIPQELGLLTSLQTLYLFENGLSGTIPTSLSNISTLTNLAISQNKLNGNIPQELSRLTSLQTLYLSENGLSGTIPTSLSEMVNLSELYLWGNQLSGNIPNSIGNCSKLRELYLSHNNLSGSVPVELGKLTLLERLSLQYNQFSNGSATTFPFLLALTNCSHLKTLNLRENNITGIFPISIGKLSTNLSFLSLSGNLIEGNILPHIGNLSNLSYLDLSGNFLNGSIPSLGNLKNLERLYLGNNKLEGNIPNDFEHLQHLGLLDINKNMLSGNIPISLAALKQLRYLFLHHNWLSGNIPSSLGNCTNLELLDLSHNSLTGRIPREISKLSNLQFYLNFSWNLLEGSLPMEIGKISMVQAIDISVNHLIGAIPSTIGSCLELQSLNLYHNRLQGSIPDSLGNLQSLMSLDLSCNSLSGTIPVTLNKLKFLQYLNLAFNKLNGEIPRGFFLNRSNVIFLNGNPDLCGPKIFQLSSCPTMSVPTMSVPRGHLKIVKRVLLLVSGAIVFILSCLLVRFLWRGNMDIQNIDVSRAIFQKLEHQRISYQDLHIAANGFDKANLLGTGSFGLVYKGILSDGTLVAVKVLQLQNEQGEKSFKAECSVLQKVRHRNLVKIITSCSNLHFKGLVFEFMSNGSLEKHLYPNRDDNNGEHVCELGLKTRLDIAIDVAHAIEYLHHDSSVQVVHCDIKPSNVLLDEDMVGHVTDFGIARLIGESSTSSLTLRGSVGYITPEYGLGGTISTQGDVYSYGILLLEMFTRKQPTSDKFVGDLNLHNWVNLTYPNRLKEVIDSSLFSEVDGDEFEENNVHKCLISLMHVGLLCSKYSPKERPTMRVVASMLESIREDLRANAVASRGMRRSISSFLSNANATRNDVHASNEQISSTF